MKRLTRQEFDCPIFGPPCLFKKTMLPTIADVMKHILYIRNDLKVKKSGKQPAISEVLDAVGRDVVDVWTTTTSLLVVTIQRVKQQLKKNYDKYLHFLRYPKSKQSDNFKTKLEQWKNKCLTEVFDICTCKCSDFDYCSCPREKKVPVLERAFLCDQRNERKMVIGGIDPLETKKLREKLSRKLKLTGKPANQRKITLIPRQRSQKNREPASCSNATEHVDPQPSTSTNPDPIYIKSKRNRLNLPTLARVCDHYGISDRSAAAVASAVLQDVGLVTSENVEKVIDRSKVRRARKRVRENFQSQDFVSEISSIYFDGRKDKTLVYEKRGQRLHKVIAAKEHISLIIEPGSFYLGHLTPTSGTGKAIADSILSFLTKNDVDMSNLIVIGCDGTATNTGWKSGVIRFIELKIRRPLQWFVCQLHANELPLRHLFTKLDGPTSGPLIYSGPIGKALENCVSLPVVEFSAVPGNMPVLSRNTVDSLSTDQKYLYQICLAVSSGSCPQDLSNRNPGKMAHSRWLTTANRILRLYVATHNPSAQLNILTEYIVKVYAPVWFSIKKESSFKHGPIHVYKLIEFSRCLSSQVKEIIDPVIKRNSFFAHPENLLLAMLHDERPHIKELGLRRIIAARKNHKPGPGVRIFKLPKLNFDARDYIDMIIWDESQITPPPMLNKISDNDLEQLISSESQIDIEFSEYPCHTQAVERCVKMVSEVSITVAGEKARDGFIRSKIRSRTIMPFFNTKNDYKLKKKLK